MAMRLFATLTVALSLAVPSLNAIAQVAAQPPTTAPAPAAPASSQTYALRYQFAAGQIRNYNVAINMSGAATFKGKSIPMTEQISMLLAQTVTAVNPDGSATIATTLISADSTVKGNPVPFSDDQIAEMQKSMPPCTISPNGAIKSPPAAGGPANPGASSYADFSRALALPDIAVKVGDSWRGSMTAMGLTFFTRSTLSQIVQQGADNVAQIETKYYGSTGQKGTPAAGSGTLYMLTSGTGADQFDTTTGTMLSMTNNLDTKITITPPPGPSTSASPPVKAHITVTLKMEILGQPQPAQTQPVQAPAAP